MPVAFKSESQQLAFKAVLGELRALGYLGDLLVEDYRFCDWFAPNTPERKIPAAAFAQTPIAYDSACFGVAVANGESGRDLTSRYRALGAPIVFEIAENAVREWAIAPDVASTQQIAEIPFAGISDRFAEHARDWVPAEFLRSKNIGDFRWTRQLELFAGLVPELESQIQEKLSPMLRDAMSFASREYKESAGQSADPEKLFKLIFSILTAKVFHDRDVIGFRSLETDGGVDAALDAVARHYRETTPRLLNKQTREAAFSRIWAPMNFRNLSVEILAELWSTQLVTPDVRKRLGIHRTPRTIAKYLVDRIPFDNVDDDHKTVVEPCCGSAVFLIAAMNRLRTQQWGLSSRARHKYFTEHLVGFEVDPFGVEISKLALTLADFPNPRDWQIVPGDVFSPDSTFPKALESAGVVLCNPPFESFSTRELKQYGIPSIRKPVHLLDIVLRHLHPRGTLGFVLPRNVIDGREYKGIRSKLAARFASIEVTSLPDQAFTADHEVALLVAHQPIPHRMVATRHLHVADSASAWQDFEWRHEVTSDLEALKSQEDCAASLAIPQLAEAWNYLASLDRLGNIADLHRGIEWNLKLTDEHGETGNREKLVSRVPKNGFALGVPPEAKISCYLVPELKYLDMREKHQYFKAYLLPWDRPKVMLNAVTKSRGWWRIAAFADTVGIPGYQNITAIWPHNYDVTALAAVLNGPVANAYVATREGKRHVTKETLKEIPIPVLSDWHVKEINDLVRKYVSMVSDESFELRSQTNDDALSLVLQRIDAVVLDAYGLPPRVERELLDRFADHRRPVPFAFGNYFPTNFEPNVPLAEHLSDSFRQSTTARFLENLPAITDPSTIAALEALE